MRLGWAEVPAEMGKALEELARKWVREPDLERAQLASRDWDCSVLLRHRCFRRYPLAETEQAREREQERKVMAAGQAVSRCLERSRLLDLGRRAPELRHLLAVKVNATRSVWLPECRGQQRQKHALCVRTCASAASELRGADRRCSERLVSTLRKVETRAESGVNQKRRGKARGRG